MASSSSAYTPDQLIEKIIMTKADQPDFDLSELVKQIDVLLARYGAQLGRRNRNRSRLDELPSASDASNFAEQVSTNVNQIANEIKEYSGNKHETSIAVLNSIGNIHWVAVGFLVVGAALKIAYTIRNNKEECFRLLKSMNDLAKVILQLQPLTSLNMNLKTMLKDSINLIVEGAILCCSQKQKKGILKRVWKASTDGQELERLNKDIDDMRNMLDLQIGASTLQIEASTFEAVKALKEISHPGVPIFDNDAVGIEEKIKEVIQHVDLENDKTTTAVIVYGIGGCGKTTLADAVYASLQDKLCSGGWKHSRVTLIQNLERNPNIAELQSLILQDLTGTIQNIRDFRSGRHNLKDVLEKEPVFLYIDNALFREPLENLLPKDVRKARKFRLLLTARDTTISGVIEASGVEPCKRYLMESLSIDASLQVLCQKIDRNREKDSILKERPQAREIAKKYSSCPLFLEVIGGYLHERNNEVEAYERVLKSLQSGEDFCGSKNFSFDEKRVLFSYEELRQNAQEAFLDLCYFFYSWEWETVACIVGEEEMKCLEEGALIKRKNKKIKIHDLILAAGRNKSKHSRLQNIEDFSLTLKNKEPVSDVKGIWMEYGHCGENSSGPPIIISAEELDATKRSLRVLYVGYLAIMKGKCREHFDQLRFLHVGKQWPNLAISIFKFEHLRYLSISGVGEDITLSASMNLPNLKVLEFSWRRIHGIAEIGHLRSLKQLDLMRCNTDGISQCFSNLHNLRRLRLSECKDLTELPESLVKLRCLEELHLSGCKNLKQLPAEFGELISLTKLDLSDCRRLQDLPCDLEKLPSLKSLNIRGCSSLTCIPHSLGGMSVWGSWISFDGCSSLSELPEEICKHAMVREISLDGCCSLKMLPTSFGQLSCLRELRLSGCKSLQKLCNDFHCLVGLKSLSLRNCKKLSSLPLGFGKLSSLDDLDLSGCHLMKELCSDFLCLVGLKSLRLSNCNELSSLPLGFGKLSCLKYLDLSGCHLMKELCSDFHCLVALRKLNLSECDSLCKLPDRFGELSCLASLDMSGCSNLVSLCDDFHCLECLTRLDLSKCEKLGCEWIDRLGSMRRLWRLDIVHCQRMKQRWMETKNQKERNLVVVADIPQWWDEEGGRALLFEGVLAKVFDEEGLLVDAHQRSFHSSSLLLPHTPIIFIMDSPYHLLSYYDNWKALGKNLQQMQTTSKELQIIYVGKHYKSIQSELPISTILAYAPDNSRTSSFCHELYSLFDIGESDVAVFRSSDEIEHEKGLKCLSAWEDISSYMLDPVAFLIKNPIRESNIDLLRELLVTEDTDYLLLNENHKVKVADLQGKIILLLVTDNVDENQVSASAVKEMYVKMQQERHCYNHLFQVVWVPIPNYVSTSWEEFERAAANAPWPRVPNPWLVRDRILSFVVRYDKIPCVCVVDEKGRISNKDALATIDRWGEEAFPFSEAREEELWKAEWEAFKSSFQLLFRNLMEFLPNRAEERRMLICVGPPWKMKEVVTDLNRALTMLETDFHVIYVAHSNSYFYNGKFDDEMASCQKMMKELDESVEMCSTATLPLCDVYKFWRRVKHLRKELMRGILGIDERIVKARRMVLGLANADRLFGIRILVVDGNGDMVSGRGMEMVELLCHGEEESKVKFLEEIKLGGVLEKSVESRWRDGIIHPKHYPQHPLLELQNRNKDISCSLCGLKDCVIYQCNVCEKYVLCTKCGESGV